MYLKQADDPPYLSVGTAVSAKYKGAFCEAKVSKVVRVVKCKVTYKMGLGIATVSDEHIKGTLRVGHTVLVKHPEKKEMVEATIAKIQDCSQYTVVFDDGDITTLRRTALCLKSGRHFNESETLDQLPLTHPEHFGNPVVGGRRGRRNRQLKDDSSEGEAEEENEPDLEGYSSDIGRVVSVETTDKKRGKDNWFPGLVVIPSAQPTVRINVKDEYLIRSFKDGRYYTVPKKEVSEFSREMGEKAESSVLVEAVSKAISFLDKGELPVHWEKNSLFNMQQNIESDSEENYSDSSDDGPNEEKDRFVAQLYKFMDDSGTPLNKSPMIANKDVDLHRLFRVVHKLGGYNRVTNQNKWRSVTMRLKLLPNQITYNQVKNVYKKCLFSYEAFYRTLGVTMLNHTRSTKKNRGRSLIRDKDRSTPVNSGSPKPDNEDAEAITTPTATTPVSSKKEEIVAQSEANKKNVNVEKKKFMENSDNSSSSSETTDQSESTPSTSREVGRPRRLDKSVRERKNASKTLTTNTKAADSILSKKDDDEKLQQTRSKSQTTPKQTKDSSVERVSKKETKSDTVKTQPKQTAAAIAAAAAAPTSAVAAPASKKNDEEKKRGRKRIANPSSSDEKSSMLPTPNSGQNDPSAVGSTLTSNAATPAAAINASEQAVISGQNINIGDKLKVYYGPTHESKVTYEAKVIEVKKDSSGLIYRVHYTGWNTRYDEWINPIRIAENLSANTKAKRLKQGGGGGGNANKNANNSKTAGKRGRGMSITGRSTIDGPPARSTTPSSVTSSSSRTKSPATPATRSTSRLTRQDYGRKTRRSSAQTDISNHSESDSEISESESELSRTRSGTRLEETTETVRTYNRKRTVAKTPTKAKDDKEDEESESNTKPKQQRAQRKVKKSPEKLQPPVTADKDDSDDESLIGSTANLTKGRDFDLNQIRSELKGFSKAVVKSSSAASSSTTIDSNASAEKETLSSSSSSEDSTSTTQGATKLDQTLIDDTKLEVMKQQTVLELEKSPSSEDIYEFKEPEPFEFESSRPSKIIMGDDKLSCKKRIPRIFEDLEKSPKRTTKLNKSPSAMSSSSGATTPKMDKTSPSEMEKKYRKASNTTPIKKSDDYELIDDKKDDLFDKLVESPSFNLINKSDGKSAATPTTLNETKSKAVKNLELELFRDFNKPSIDELSRDDIDLSDDDDTMTIQTQSLFSNRNSDELFTTNSSTATTTTRNTLEAAFSQKSDENKKESDEFDSIRESITRAILRTSSSGDEYENLSDEDLLITPSLSSYQGKKRSVDEGGKLVKLEGVKNEMEKCMKMTISSALQESDSKLMQSLCNSNAQSVGTSSAILSSGKLLLDEKLKDMKTVTSGTKIADSILQKFNSIKNEPGDDGKKEINNKVDGGGGGIKKEIDVKSLDSIMVIKPGELKVKPSEIEKKLVGTGQTAAAVPLSSVTNQMKSNEFLLGSSSSDMNKKKRKVVSKAYIEDSDSDSSDSEQLVIVRSDEDSTSQQEAKDNEDDANHKFEKGELLSASTRNFKFDKDEQIKHESIKSEDIDELNKEQDEPADSQLHSLLLCEETIPRSPAPAPETNELLTAATTTSSSPSTMKQKTSKVLEMPFASAPAGTSSSSNNSNINISGNNNSSSNKNILINNEHNTKQLIMPPTAAHGGGNSGGGVGGGNVSGNNQDASAAVLDNTPPTTPESSISNLSPQRDGEDLSPNTVENESCKSNDADTNEYTRKRRNSAINKVGMYSEDDSMTNEGSSSVKKSREDLTTLSGGRKRRKSTPRADEALIGPVKRGRKPLNRSRHNSDSDDTSEHSLLSGPTTAQAAICPTSATNSLLASGIVGTTTTSGYGDHRKSPRPSKYNFFVEFDPSLNSGQRIAVLQQKLSELRKTYAEVKSELAAVERRRKKIRRREREALKASKQEMVCG